ncbi:MULTISPECIES: DUF4439 domain-containing protein [unclassified Corynebacterium]|uniref:DUF4439 domain-containing protein n=1 Tax=unclassified Corynebacterium TaxID=2624378 RepID=UPI001EF73A2A|nr:DUF4439 domain-containing protein [Corynebacterium sp. ACRPZ]MCG7294536.1 DUF4439 domain-containing protein [Corynebacterium sp. ACRPY]
MKKLLLLPAAALLLTSCTVMDVVGPRANGEIMALAKQASADWSGGDPAREQWREMRKKQSEELKGEARRLCGLDAQGQTPTSCDVSYGDTDLPATGNADALLEHTVAAADKVPAESVDLIVAQAIDALTLSPVDLEPVTETVSDTADTEAARDMLARENAVYYGLGLALAYADSDLRERVGELREASHERTAALTRVLDVADGEALVPAAGYEFAEGYAEPANAEDAAQLVKTMQSDLVKQWRYAAAHAESATWRGDAIRLAAHAQRV